MTLNQLLELQGIIHCDPEIMSGVPVFVGTRVPLQTFFDYLEGENGLAEFINDFPYLETQTMKVLENNNCFLYNTSKVGDFLKLKFST